MTGAEVRFHVDEAVRLLHVADHLLEKGAAGARALIEAMEGEDMEVSGGPPHDLFLAASDRAAPMIQMAQVHATLAVALREDR